MTVIASEPPPAATLIPWLLEHALEQLDLSGEEEAAIYVNNAIEILKSKAQSGRCPS